MSASREPMLPGIVAANGQTLVSVKPRRGRPPKNQDALPARRRSGRARSARAPAQDEDIGAAIEAMADSVSDDSARADASVGAERAPARQRAARGLNLEHDPATYYQREPDSYGLYDWPSINPYTQQDRWACDVIPLDEVPGKTLEMWDKAEAEYGPPNRADIHRVVPGTTKHSNLGSVDPRKLTRDKLAERWGPGSYLIRFFATHRDGLRERIMRIRAGLCVIEAPAFAAVNDPSVGKNWIDLDAPSLSQASAQAASAAVIPRGSLSELTSEAASEIARAKVEIEIARMRQQLHDESQKRLAAEHDERRQRDREDNELRLARERQEADQRLQQTIALMAAGQSHIIDQIKAASAFQMEQMKAQVDALVRQKVEPPPPPPKTVFEKAVEAFTLEQVQKALAGGTANEPSTGAIIKETIEGLAGAAGALFGQKLQAEQDRLQATLNAQVEAKRLELGYDDDGLEDGDEGSQSSEPVSDENDEANAPVTAGEIPHAVEPAST
jgi:hypothetical protein